MYQFQKRILALEHEFINARRTLKRLLRQLRYAPESVTPAAVRSQLGLVNSLIRLIKEETAFYAKLGQLYDFSKLVDALRELLVRRDPEEAKQLLEEINRIWTRKETMKPVK